MQTVAHRSGWSWAVAIMGIVAVCLVRSAGACNIPVFRYALERWEPYPYELLVFYEGELPADVRDAMDALQDVPLNLDIWLVDVQEEGMHEDIQAVWRDETHRATLPWGVVRYPYPYWSHVATNKLWRGQVTLESLRHITDSPARRAVAEHILKGVSAVWLFIEGVDPAENEARYKVLRERLDWVRSMVELPDIAMVEVAQGQMAEGEPGYVPMKIDFEIVRIRRDDPVERFFVDSLLTIEKDHETFSDKPFVFPIFGQGRALWGLSGDGIAPGMIEDACAFLLGACSCTIKDSNPGVDMLVRADWYGGVSNLLSVASDAPALVGMALPEAEPATEPDAEAERDIPMGVVMVATLLVLLLAVALIGRKALRSRER